MNVNHRKVLVWDWAIRVFHWLFAASISLALGIALIWGEHSSVFQWHMLFGISAGFLLIIRMVLFFVGSRHINVRGLFSSLRMTGHHLQNFFSQQTKPNDGHNPLAWIVYLTMFALLAGTVLTGINADQEWTEEIHPVFAWALLAMIVLHLAGLAIHTIRFKENIALSMVTGKKRAAQAEGIPSSKTILGVFVLAVSLAFIGQLFAAYQPGATEVKLPWINRVITLEESEEHEEQGDELSNKRQNADHDDDDA